MRLGVNIDHVATIRNARGGKHPNPLDAANIVEKANANSWGVPFNLWKLKLIYFLVLEKLIKNKKMLLM